jgi:hypothetical protein
MKRYLAALMLLGSIGFLDVALAQSMKPSENDTIRTPAEGYVPDAKVAEQIAYAVLVPVYGREAIDFQRPFRVTLVRRGTSWRIEGTLPESVAHGGNFVVEIAKRDGRIIRVVDYK